MGSTGALGRALWSALETYAETRRNSAGGHEMLGVDRRRAQEGLRSRRGGAQCDVQICAQKEVIKSLSIRVDSWLLKATEGVGPQ